jgi:hypothetical protein
MNVTPARISHGFIGVTEPITDSNFKQPKDISCRTVIASGAKQSISPREESMDCFASLAMTWNSRHDFAPRGAMRP